MRLRDVPNTICVTQKWLTEEAFKLLKPLSWKAFRLQARGFEVWINHLAQARSEPQPIWTETPNAVS